MKELKTQKQSYGSLIIAKKGNSISYQVQFHNLLLNEIQHRQTFRIHEEAIEFLRNCNFNFFSEYPNLLPKSISLNRRDKSYVFCITIRGKTVRISSSKDLDKICEDKFNLIKTILT